VLADALVYSGGRASLQFHFGIGDDDRTRNSDMAESRKRLTLKIDGMHCVNCEVFIERSLKKVTGVSRVNANYGTGEVEIVYSGDLDLDRLRGALSNDGYTIVSSDKPESSAVDRRDATNLEYLEIGAAFLVLAGLFFFLKQFDLLPRGFGITENMSYGLVFLIGLVASVSSCIAVTGGLLVALAAKYNEANAHLTNMQRLKPHIYFNAGRIVSYTLLGGVVGALGSTLTLTPGTTGALTIIASLIMIALGLQMLKLIPSLGRFQPRMPKFLAHKIHDLSTRGTKSAAFVLGASTFFLPCGFTQALQLYVLSKGSFTTGALTMLAFALGTLPALVSLSAISSYARGNFQRYFLKLAGAAVIFLGIANIQNGLVLTGTTVNAASLSGVAKIARQIEPAEPATQTAGEVPDVEPQIVNMKIDGLDYIPNRFTVKQGVPVEWNIDAEHGQGCGRIIIAPKLGIRKILYGFAINTIKFTPQEAGDFYFNCGMGMMTPGSKFTVVPNKGS
jgi:sulfite exporter TauE/SafE/copper chaperone CopZ